MVVLCPLLGLVALAIALPLVALATRAGRRLGLLDQPGAEAHKRHTHAVPTTGGIGIFIAIAVPMLGIIAAAWLVPVDAWSGPLAAVAQHVEGLRRTTPQGLAILTALLVMHVVGLVDDRVRLGPWSKLAAQVAVAAVLAVAFDVRVLHVLGAWGPAGVALSVALSILWLVAITNAFNMLDNMDGLSAGVAAIIAAVYLGATLLGGQWFVASLAALLLGALVGFLVFNFPPAKVYMGDAGSLVVGLLLAVVSVKTTYFSGISQDGLRAPGTWYAALMPLLVMAVPLYDFTSVTVIRALQGHSPFRGDTNHFSHRLVRKGLSRRAAVLVIWLATAATALGGVTLARLPGWAAALAAAQAAAVLTLLAVLERTPPTTPDENPHA